MAHPLANKSGEVYYHRHVASVKIGRWLRRDEVVHHKDGDRANNDYDNLEITTRSDHAKTHNPIIRKSRNCAVCGEETKNQKYCSNVCQKKSLRRVERPSTEKLREMINQMSWVAIGRYYGVSDNAVRKWARRYGLIE